MFKIEINNKVSKGIMFYNPKSLYYPLKKGSITKEYMKYLKFKNSGHSMKDCEEKGGKKCKD
ncbi:hypothetical protein KAH94_04635 [bacterium]|nr:hypothetical protein [bacterium]